MSSNKDNKKTTTRNTERSRHIGLGDSSVRGRLATGRFDQRSDIGHVWREQQRLTRERWKLESEEPTFYEVLKVKAKKILKDSIKITARVPKAKRLLLKSKSLSSRSRLIAGTGMVLLATIAVPIFMSKGKHEKNTDKASLGAVTTESSVLNDNRIEEKPDFKVLYPSDKKDLTSVTRRAPSGDVLHTYKDAIEEVEIEVTQQQVPESFKENQQEQLEKMAKNFLATNVIQIDTLTVFHGRSEKSDVQSLFFIKGESLFSIKSAKPLSDDVWAAYIINLQ